MLQIKEANNTIGLPVNYGYWEPANFDSKTLDCFTISKVRLYKV